MRIVVLREDYCGAMLGMTDLTNEELKALLVRAEENADNDVYQPITEICEELFPYNTFVEMGCTEQSEFYGINELNTIPIVHTTYLTFSVVNSEK